MSHEATNWAIKQRGLKPSAKIVLWHLCDRYHPDQGCFPSLDTLADDCEMSRRSVQDQIAELEKIGLVSVEKMPREKGRLPRNRYRFPFEISLGQILPKANPALGNPAPPPLANSGKSLGQILPTNLVKRTSKRTSKPPCADCLRALMEVMSEAAAVSFIEHRRAKRAKLTPHAAKLIADKLRGHSRPEAVIEASIMNGWTGVFPEKVQAPAARLYDLSKFKG